MSEHQYYEFMTIGRKLTAKERAALEGMSSHAEITSTRFRVSYDWSDFRGDPRKLVARYFDAHVYSANWGARRLVFRLPAGTFDATSARRYFVKDVATLTRAGEHVIVDVSYDEDGSAALFYDEVPSLARLAPLRAELIAGDLRFAYLVCLFAVQLESVPEDAREPPLPAGLRKLSAAQRAFVALFANDDDLLAAAAAASTERGTLQQPRARTVAVLRASANEARVARETAAEKAAVRERKKAADAGNKRLDAIAAGGPAACARLEADIEARRYHEAVALALDLRDLAAREGTTDAFAIAFEALKKRQVHRPTFGKHWGNATR